MYPVEGIYSLKSYCAWHNGEANLKPFRSNWKEIRHGDFWPVSHWDELREAVSFLSLMNKRQVLYFRGQRAHYHRCLPTLFRPYWCLEGKGDSIVLNEENIPRYHECLSSDLRERVHKAVVEIGTPRDYIIKILPAATASILQHYELWPTLFIDLTRSLPTAVAFAMMKNNAEHAYLYVVAMPDLRGSITTDLDQQLTLSRLEAVCPPAAKRPHHQDAYLVARAPEPPDETRWEEWKKRSDLMRRLVAKFRLDLNDGVFPGTPQVSPEYLIPENDSFRMVLRERLLPTIKEQIIKFAA